MRLPLSFALTMQLTDWIGTLGVGLILAAYFCSTFHWIGAHSRLYFILNTTGALLACLASWLIAYWPFVILEGTWTVVSLMGWIKAKE